MSALAVVLVLACSDAAQAADITYPAEKSTPVSLTLKVASFTDPLAGGIVYSRGFDGTIPGPTIRTKPGETLAVTLTNNLGEYSPDCATTGEDFCYLNTTNMHTHGLHVSSETGQDDIFTEVKPGASATYAFVIPEYHMGGTHWYHPHLHHATAVQAGGGAAGVLIVDDPAGAVPPEVSSMTEHVLFICMVNMATVTDLAGKGLGQLWSQTSSTSNVALVNGHYQPTITVPAGAWQRLRIVFAAIEQKQVVTISGTAECYFQLLAKDGVYLHSAPRTITTMTLVPGARADVALACGCASPPCTAVFESGATRRLQGGGPGGPGETDMYTGTLFSISVTGTFAKEDISILPTFQVKRPCYLVDLQSATIPSANQHSIELVGGDWIVKWDGSGETFGHSDPIPDALATINVGEVHEWAVNGVKGHPFHLHVSPYQIKSLSTADEYFAVGDWHDTFMHDADDVVVRLQTDNFAGKYVIHCHILEHEDQGMMAYLSVSGASGTSWSGAAELDSTCYTTASGVGYTTIAATTIAATTNSVGGSTTAQPTTSGGGAAGQTASKAHNPYRVDQVFAALFVLGTLVTP